MKTSHVLGELLGLANSIALGGDASEAGRLRTIARRLLSVLHHRDPATVEHSRRVAMVGVGIAEMLGWTARQRSLLEVAALVHDIGKIGVPDHVLLKPGKLSSGEYDLIIKYHRVAISIFQACRADREFVQMLSQMHDQYCDSEEQLSGEVHLGSRILAVADAYDSLSTSKAFRRGHTHDEVMSILNEQSGTRFDGNIVRALSRWYEREGKALLTLDECAISQQQSPLTDEQLAEIHLFGTIFGCLSLIESTYDGLCIVDRHQNVVVWNGGSEELLMRPADQLLGRRLSNQLIPSKPADENATATQSASTVAAVLADGEVRLDKRLMQRSDETWIELEVQTIPIHDANGICGVAEIFNDKSTSGTKSHEYRELKLQASRDALTGVANRGRLETQLEKMLDELKQTGGAFPISIIFLDVDHFKSINDNYGHAVGDRVLVELAKSLQHETYSGELVGRYGGEEFVLLCPDTGVDDAVRRAERLRTAIAASDIGGLEDRKITASFGVGEVQMTDTVQTAFDRADKFLYEAKQTGRNRVCWPGYNEEEEEKQVDEEENNQGTFEKTADGFLYNHTVIGNFSPEILRIKLGTFADENFGIMLDYDGKSAKIQFGEKGLLPFWGAENDRKPVEVELILREVRSAEPDRKRPYRPVEVDITMKSVGWVRKMATFETRCRDLMEGLRWILSVE
jgi:diguanylate cyclase (GGDEF)-like protein